jgi:four helix bundle protein
MLTRKYIEFWKNSIDFLNVLYNLTKVYPIDELLKCVSQMSRFSVPIPSNIAEVASKKGKLEYKHFYTLH